MRVKNKQKDAGQQINTFHHVFAGQTPSILRTSVRARGLSTGRSKKGKIQRKSREKSCTGTTGHPRWLARRGRGRGGEEGRGEWGDSVGKMGRGEGRGKGKASERKGEVDKRVEGDTLLLRQWMKL